MDKLELPLTDFTPIKKPENPKEEKELEKTEYLDELYSEEWLNKYFNSKQRDKSSERRALQNQGKAQGDWMGFYLHTAGNADF